MQVVSKQPGLHLRPHATVATLIDADHAKLVRVLRALPVGTDVAEVRLDALWPKKPEDDAVVDILVALVEASPVPLLATMRPRRQGGRFEGPEHDRLAVLQGALKAGFAAADIEMDGPDAVRQAHMFRHAGDVVPSLHLDEKGRRGSNHLHSLVAMQNLGAAYEKLAFTASAFPDLLSALEIARTHHLRGGCPAIFTMKYGSASARALMPLAGNRVTYGHAPGSRPAVAGQPGLVDIQATWDHWGLTRDDLDECAQGLGQWLAVLGSPVSHSLSPALHNAALRHAGRRERYGALEVQTQASLELVLQAAPRIGLVGASVTAPHKQAAAALAVGDASTQAIGAANCLRFESDEAYATNTDASALARLARPHVAADDVALVLGAGGAARAAVHALVGLGMSVVAASRDPDGRGPLESLGATWTPWETRDAVHPRLVVNATTVGSRPGDASPLPVEVLDTRPIVVELTYAAGETALQRSGLQAGCQIIDGQAFLLEQAVDSYRHWFGSEPHRDAMLQALQVPK